MSELAVEANVQMMVELDSGQLVPPLLGNLPVASDKLKSVQAIALQSDVEEFLKSKINNAAYINGAFVGGTVTFASIETIPLSSKLKKEGEFVVLKGDVICKLSAVQGKNPQGVPDPKMPTQATITLTPTQAKLKA